NVLRGRCSPASITCIVLPLQSHSQSPVSFLTPATICSAVSVGSEGNYRASFCPVTRSFTWVPPISTTSTCMMHPPRVYLACARAALLEAMTPSSSFQALTHDLAPSSWSLSLAPVLAHSRR